MTEHIRFGDVMREVGIDQTVVSYNDLTPKPEYDAEGRVKPYVARNLRLAPGDVYNLLSPYVGARFWDQVRSVLPLAVYLVLFQILILRQTVTDSWVITAGMGAVIVGLMLFMEGLKLGLMPFAGEIGDRLPKRSPLPVVLLIAFLLGIGVTFAEPAIGALQAVGAGVDVSRAPYLYALLNQWTGTLVLMVGIGVGAAAVLGTVRFLYGWSLKPFIYAALVPTLALSVYCWRDPHLAAILGLAWDCGAVTTGPVTVPLVLSLGIGIASAGGKGGSSLSGFGIVTLASLFPVLAVLGLGVYLSAVTSPEAVIHLAQTASAQSGAAQPAWFETTPGAEIIGGFRAIVPLVIFLFLVMRLVLRTRLHDAGIVAYGLVLAVAGMIVFNIGLSYGLAKLGGQSGSLVPAAFLSLEGVRGSPLYMAELGLVIAMAFAWILGFGATLAEPALNALGITVENLTQGAFRKTTLIYAVSIGVGFGILTGVLRIIYDIEILYLVLPGYVLAMALTAVSSEEFVNVAWDSAGVTTGPVTVPLVLAMGLGFGGALGAVDGFGILAMASIGPIVSVLLTGVWVSRRHRRRMAAETTNAQLVLAKAEGIEG
ncbi:MAG: DUF1538 domain-containing protein [Alphaproteobacteria bacterium]|nr:DUF1538 domain-containing protein [Alphaproteobacteria bacterium]